MPKLALLGGEPVRDNPYPSWPVYDERDVAVVTEVIQSGRWGGFPYPGPKTAEFAKCFEELQGGGYAVPMANGSITMEVALRASNVGWGDEVLIPAYTFQATAAAVIAAGAIPIIVDVDPQTYCIDLQKAESTITSKTKAIVVVHLGAQMTDMDGIMAIAEKYDLVVVEDAAHATGAKWNGKGAGNIGHFGSFSLQSSKTLSTGEGGVLLCSTPGLAACAASIINCGRPHDIERRQYSFGINYRMTEIQAALGIVALDRFPKQTRQREEMAEYLEEELRNIPGIRLLLRDPRHSPRSFWRYVFAIDPEKFGCDHKAVCAALKAEGIPCWIGFESLHRCMLFQPNLSKLPVPTAFPERFDFENMYFPEAERACEREAVWLEENIFRAGHEGIDDAVAAIRKIQENFHELSQLKISRSDSFSHTQLFDTAERFEER